MVTHKNRQILCVTSGLNFTRVRNRWSRFPRMRKRRHRFCRVQERPSRCQDVRK
ncbi:hypothetical protein COLSTE_01388 [Collinsella stercoris DSM 13279]|uniref:Uncharacterized protein n=1 Tax=Collinsella stercoris DSM 13279 TaxID=445975 RepID=B6GBC9_9ACTN|nr:hypothetical protein COLSTE_01388 [Collinsella stercoris DSM 13279]